MTGQKIDLDNFFLNHVFINYDILNMFELLYLLLRVAVLTLFGICFELNDLRFRLLKFHYPLSLPSLLQLFLLVFFILYFV